MKYIYLDQNKWIELAKGLKEENSDYIELYKVIMKNVEESIWAFPLSSIHITETMKRKNEDSRKEILDLMFKVSRGYAICDYMTADNFEFEAWKKNKEVDCSQLKEMVVCHDWASLIGLKSENVNIQLHNGNFQSDIIQKMISEHCCDRIFFDSICNIMNKDIIEDEEYFYSCFTEGRQSFLTWKAEISKLEVYKDKHLYPAYLINMFFEAYREKILTLSPNDRKNIWDLFQEASKNKTSFIANLESLPGFNVHNRLIYEMYNNPDKDVHKHDFNDLAYLRVAIPYCDIVIGEKYWCNRVCNYRLDKKYNTIVSTNLLSLMDV